MAYKDPDPGHAVALTDGFLKDCAAASLSEGEINSIVNHLSRDPKAET